MSDPANAQVPPTPPADAAGGKGLKGAFHDASTLAATGLILAVLLAIVAGVVNFLVDPAPGGKRVRLMALTDTFDVGDVALLGIAIALLLLTPDPPGGVPRWVLMQLGAVIGGVLTLYALIRCGLIITETSVGKLSRLAQFTPTLGVAIGAFTVTWYAAKESFLKEHENDAP